MQTLAAVILLGTGMVLVLVFGWPTCNPLLWRKDSEWALFTAPPFILGLLLVAGGLRVALGPMSTWFSFGALWPRRTTGDVDAHLERITQAHLAEVQNQRPRE